MRVKFIANIFHFRLSILGERFWIWIFGQFLLHGATSGDYQFDQSDDISIEPFLYSIIRLNSISGNFQLQRFSQSEAMRTDFFEFKSYLCGEKRGKGRKGLSSLVPAVRQPSKG